MQCLSKNIHSELKLLSLEHNYWSRIYCFDCLWSTWYCQSVSQYWDMHALPTSFLSKIVNKHEHVCRKRLECKREEEKGRLRSESERITKSKKDFSCISRNPWKSRICWPWSVLTSVSATVVEAGVCFSCTSWASERRMPRRGNGYSWAS